MVLERVFINFIKGILFELVFSCDLVEEICECILIFKLEILVGFI